MEEHAIAPIDLVVVNLYPFLNTVMSGADRDTIIENIDIGGPSMVRSAAKNHAHVAIVTDPADYAALLDQLGQWRDDDRLSQDTRRQGLCADCSLRFDHLAMVRLCRSARTLARNMNSREQAQDAASLRRKSTPAGGALRTDRPPCSRDRPGRTGPGEGAKLQQPQRRQCSARARVGVPKRRAYGRDRQTRQPVRRRDARNLDRCLARSARL